MVGDAKDGGNSSEIKPVGSQSLLAERRDRKSMARRQRGTGRLYQPPGCEVWWAKYSVNGKPERQSTGERDKRKAESWLKNRLAAVTVGSYQPGMAKVTVRELMDDYFSHCQNQGVETLQESKARWANHLEQFFGKLRVSQLSTDLLNRYIARRQSEDCLVNITTKKEGVPKKRTTDKKPTNGTINRELGVLRAAMRHARRVTPPKIQTVPYFPMLPEAPARDGFLTDAQYLKLAEECSKVGLWMLGLFEVGVNYAWRRSEPQNLKVRQIDLEGRRIRLTVGSTKNGDGRNIKMTKRVYEILKACCEGKQPDDYVFTRENGKRVRSFRKRWDKVTSAAGVPGLLYHDLRRTGARNMRIMGIPEQVVMKIGGWKTSAMFRRYDIVDESDLDDATRRMEERQKQLEQSQHEAQQQAQDAEAKQNESGHSLGIVGKNEDELPKSQSVN